jgi:hypothetical protein
MKNDLINSQLFFSKFFRFHAEGRDENWKCHLDDFGHSIKPKKKFFFFFFILLIFGIDRNFLSKSTFVKR